VKRALSTLALALAAFALGGVAAAGEGLADLIKLLKNKDEYVRLKAAKALGKLGVRLILFP
jgi:HEAT repeat protein